MTPEKERWAETLAALQNYGDSVFAHVAERVRALALAGDIAGVRRWTNIAAKLDELCEAEDRLH